MKRAVAESTSDATATISLPVAAIKQVTRPRPGSAQAPTVAFAPLRVDADEADTTNLADLPSIEVDAPADAADFTADLADDLGTDPDSIAAESADSDSAPVTSTSAEASSTEVAFAEATSAETAATSIEAGFTEASPAEAEATSAEASSAEVAAISAEVAAISAEVGFTEASPAEPEASSASAEPASTDLVPTTGTDLVPTTSTDIATPAFLAATDLATPVPTSGVVAVPTTADDVIATIHAAATVVRAADRRARQAAFAKADPWTGLDLRQPAAPAPVDNVLELLSPVLERPLLVVEQPGLPDAADVVALHRSELEVDFVEPPVVAAGAEPAIPPRFGPGLSVLPHIEFPV
ncbi:hypothetical protein [Catenulispora pinisilvae]|uniref:hypothetical protein n=1 Tax=Catenulispora pinisilvae TaxID=2705253 RepID=UPI001891651D|nr:hypothetical protein [Catenulispora pinisilvae]